MKYIRFVGALLALIPAYSFATVGSYAPIPCDNAVFTTANCTTCFSGGTVWVGEAISGFSDTWSNTTNNDIVFYREEQKDPLFTALGDSAWITNPTGTGLFWKYADAVIWGKSLVHDNFNEFQLSKGKIINAIESSFGASYTLDRMSGKVWTNVWLLQFPVVFHRLDPNSVDEGAAETHTECVLFSLGSPSVAEKPVDTNVVLQSGAVVSSPEVKNAPVANPAPAPEPKSEQVTHVKTGPETTLIFFLTIILVLGFSALGKRKKYS